MGYIYKIACNVTGEVYVGASKSIECKTGGKKYYRLAGHKWGNKCSSKPIIERGNYQFIVLEDNVENDLLRDREYFYITTIKECINKNKPYIAGDGRKERNCARSLEAYHSNPEEKKQKVLDYYYLNHEKIRADMNSTVACECGLSYSKGNKLRHLKSTRHINNV
jgi:hypothetical protein